MPRTSQIIELNVCLPMWLSEARREFLEFLLKEHIKQLDKGRLFIGAWSFEVNHAVPAMTFHAPVSDTELLVDGTPWLKELANKFFYDLFASEGYDGNIVTHIWFFITTDDGRKRKVEYEYRRIDHSLKQIFYAPSKIEN